MKTIARKNQVQAWNSKVGALLVLAISGTLSLAAWGQMISPDIDPGSGQPKAWGAMQNDRNVPQWVADAQAKDAGSAMADSTADSRKMAGWFPLIPPQGDKDRSNMERKTMTQNQYERIALKLVRSTRVSPSVTAVAWSPDGRMIATTASGDSRVAVRDSHSLSPLRELRQGAKGRGESHIAFSPDGRYLASGLSTVNVWSTETWDRRWELVAPHVTPGKPQYVNIGSLAFSPDGKFLVVGYGGEYSVVIAYRLEDGGIAWSHETKRTIGKPRITTPIFFTPDGKTVILGTVESSGGTEEDFRFLAKIVVLDSASGLLRKSIDDVHVSMPTALAIGTDGKWVATGTDTGTKRQTVNLKAHRVVTIDNRDPVRVWDLDTGKLAMELPVLSRVWALAFSRDGKYVIGATHMAIAVWELESGKLIQQVGPPPDATPMQLAISPDGKELASAGGDQLLVFEFLKSD